MADPEILGALRVQAIQPSVTGLPEDVVVNAWAFHRVSAWSDAQILALRTPMIAFYAALANLGMRPSNLVTNQMIWKAYRLEEQAPREPFQTQDTVLQATAGSSNPAMPEEVAVCLSWYADRNTPRRRGRLFLGPWTTTPVITQNGHTRVTTAARSGILTAINTLQHTLKGQSVGWGHISNPLDYSTDPPTPKTPGAFHHATHAWVDDAFDTQRRRGPKTSARTSAFMSNPE